MGWAKRNPSHPVCSYTVTKPKLDLPTKFYPNRTKIAKVCFWGGFGVAGWGRLNVPPAIPFADILLLTLKYTSQPSFIQIGPKLPKFGIWGNFWVGGVG